MKLTAVPSTLARPPAAVAVPPKVADPFYLTQEWRRFSLAIKVQRNWMCEDIRPDGVPCRFDGRRLPRLIHADHVIEIKDGGAKLDPLNIMIRCQGCHNRKTAAVRARR